CWSIDKEVIDQIIPMYESTQKEYHLHSLEMNAFIKLQREKERIHGTEKKLQLNDIKLGTIYHITLDSSLKRRSFTEWLSDINEYHIFNENELEESKKSFDNEKYLKTFRGKNELFFFKEYLKLLKEELGKKNNIFNRRYKISGNIEEIISTFAQYAEYPENLKKYFQKKLP
ncbi:hypothetical protein HKH50_001950, partial [Enterococcus faecalis]|nr:hypothetical protein [Enterococcus faecalis]